MYYINHINYNEHNTIHKQNLAMNIPVKYYLPFNAVSQKLSILINVKSHIYDLLYNFNR